MPVEPHDVTTTRERWRPLLEKKRREVEEEHLPGDGADVLRSA